MQKEKNVDGVNSSQSELDKYITLKNNSDATEIEKKSCNLTAILDMIKSQAAADCITDLKNIDNKVIYDLAKEQGDAIISGKFSVADASKLAKLIDPRLDYKFVDAWPVTTDNIINQLDNNKIIKVTLSDGHRQKITGYEVVGEKPNTSLRFKIEDPVYSTEHGKGKERKISNMLVID